MKVYSSRISNLNIKYETNGWRPLLPHTDCHWRRINEQNVCRSSLDPGLVLGPLSQMTINYHQQVPIFTIGHLLSPSSREAEAAPRHDPVLIIKTPSGELVQWRANYRWWSPGQDCVSCVSARLIDASDIPSGSKTFIRLRLERSVGLPPSIDVKQHQPQHVSQLQSHA